MPAAAELGIGIRAARGTRDSVRHALREDRSLVRTYAMRRRFTWCRRTNCRSGWRRSARRPMAIGFLVPTANLDADSTDRFLAAVRDALDGQALTRLELAERWRPALVRGRMPPRLAMGGPDRRGLLRRRCLLRSLRDGACPLCAARPVAWRLARARWRRLPCSLCFVASSRCTARHGTRSTRHLDGRIAHESEASRVADRGA